jgi:hypothetical protein
MSGYALRANPTYGSKHKATSTCLIQKRLGAQKKPVSIPPSSAATGGEVRRGCLSPKGEFRAGRPLRAAQGSRPQADRGWRVAFFASFLGEARKEVARRGEIPANVTPNNGKPISNPTVHTEPRNTQRTPHHDPHPRTGNDPRLHARLRAGAPRPLRRRMGQEPHLPRPGPQGAWRARRHGHVRARGMGRCRHGLHEPGAHPGRDRCRRRRHLHHRLGAELPGLRHHA